MALPYAYFPSKSIGKWDRGGSAALYPPDRPLSAARRNIQDSLASLAPMRSMGSRLRNARKGIIFRTARVGILAERLFFIAGLYPR